MNDSLPAPAAPEPPVPGTISLVLSTAPDAETAAALARALVAEGLAACASIVPGVRSIYRWKGELCDESELLLVLKTATVHVPVLIEALKARHPYETPEIVALPVTDGFPPYLRWVLDSTSRVSGS